MRSGLPSTMKTILTVAALASTVLFAAGDPAGHYVLEGVREAGSELLLKPDGTFEYMLAYGAADYSAKGKWRSEAGAVILNTTVESGPPFRLVRGAKVKTQGLCVWVKAPNGQPIPNIDVSIQTPDGTAKQRTDDQGAARFPQINSASSSRTSGSQGRATIWNSVIGARVKL
jgi:hypothetical protein